MLKEKVKEFSDIASELPENLQTICFELLLKNYLEGSKQPTPPHKPADDGEGGGNGVGNSDGVIQEDIKLPDLHIKVRKLLEQHTISIEKLNSVFYKEDGAFLPLYDDLKTSQMAESQIRLALLLAFQSAMSSGDFEISVAAVRAACTDRKCYDSNNFAANFTKNSDLFDFDKYSKDVVKMSLSENGKRELARVLKEIE